MIIKPPNLLALASMLLLGPDLAARSDEPGVLRATQLRCESLINPLGVDLKKPRLSWRVESPERNQLQSAYQVLAASTPDLLARNHGDFWDTGRVESSQTLDLVYEGKPLQSHTYVHWKVRVWDRQNRPSDWSAPAHWSVGLLRLDEWDAQWIGNDESRELDQPDASFAPAQWIWHALDQGAVKPKGHRLFVKEFTLPPDTRVESAELLVTGDDVFRFTINGSLVAANGNDGWIKPRRVDVARHFRVNQPNRLRVEVENTAPGPAGLLAKLEIVFDNKTRHVVHTDNSWKSTDQPGPNWHDRPLDTSTWPNAHVIGDYGIPPWGRLKDNALYLPPAPYFRTEFDLRKPVRHAFAYFSAYGIADLHLNGQRVTEDRFTPGWTDYTRRIYYRAYDVTNRLRQGKNALGAILADGWYSGYVGFARQRDHYGQSPRVLAMLHLTFQDGTTDTIGTHPLSWKTSTGAIREADFLMGETHDARLEPTGWDLPAFDDSNWSRPEQQIEMNSVVEWHPGPPVVAFDTLKPRAITEPTPGAYVLDMGQNFSGVARLTIQGQPGQTIRLRFAERLNPDGTLYTTNLRDARCTDTYICRGGGIETWEPRFTFHGFQYVEITGLNGPPSPETLVGVAIASDTPRVGRFHCSDPMLNQLVSNIYWTQRSNFLDIPTDCPQRDERLGWTGDAQVYIRAATLNADVQAFFRKWLVDLTDAQRDDGQFPMVAPLKVAGDDGGPAWADAGVICPWTLYQVYADRTLLERQYPSMLRFIEFCQNRGKNGLLPPDQYHAFGDWLSINADTPKDVIYTAYFALSTHLTAQAARVLGKTEDAEHLETLFQSIRRAFQQTYLQPDGRIHGHTQAAYVLAIACDLLDDPQAKRAAEHLVADIEHRGGHLSTGFIGTKDLMLVLSKIGRNDVAYRLLHNESFPSWGFSIKHGATSIWERWDGWTPEKGFQDPAMNSFAHYSFGAVYQWMVENIAGIRADAPGYARITIAPQPGGKLRFADTTYISIRGPIVSNWSIGDRTLQLRVEIPANTTATVILPTRSVDQINESGRPLDQSSGLGPPHISEAGVTLSAASGSYVFSLPWPPTTQ